MTTVKLTGNFLATARCLIFGDGGGISWNFNPNTNVLTASGTGGGTFLSSVGLADTSTTSIFTITGSPLTANGTLDFVLNTQAANAVFAGPTTGAAGQPTFRALVAADIPTITYASLSGKPAIPTAAAPTAKVGLTATTGAAATFMASDSAPALDVTISPTWTGNHTFSASSGTSVTIHSASGTDGLEIYGANSSGNSYALYIQAGTTAGDYPVLVRPYSNSTNYFTIFGDGHGQLGPSTTSGVTWSTACTFTFNNGGTSVVVECTTATPGINVVGINSCSAGVLGIQDGQTGTRQYTLNVGSAGAGIFCIRDVTAGSLDRLTISATGAIGALASPLVKTVTQVATGLAAIKTSATTSANATIATDASLTLTFNETGWYAIEVWLAFFEATSGAGGFQFNFLNGGSVSYGVVNFSVEGFGTAAIALASGSTNAGTVVYAAAVSTSSSAPSWFRAKGIIQVTAPGQGGVMWAQNSLLAIDPTTLMAGSYVIETKIG